MFVPFVNIWYYKRKDVIYMFIRIGRMPILFGSDAKEILNAKPPDRTKLHEEAEEFEREMLKLREETLARGEKW